MGEIISILGVGISFILCKNSIKSLIIFCIVISVLLYVCEYINLKDICRKLKKNVNILKIIFKNKQRKQIHIEMDEYQKNWMTCYCKKHKLDSIKKLEIIKEELNRKNNYNSVKYLNPIIIGTLMLTVWERIISQLYKEIELGTLISAVIILSIIISVLVGNFTKQYKKQCEFMKMYSKYYGDDRLNELLVYEM